MLQDFENKTMSSKSSKKGRRGRKCTKSKNRSNESEVFVLPPNILQKLGINLENLQHITSNGSTSIENAKVSDNLNFVTDPKTMEASDSTQNRTSILETASLMTTSVFLSPTFLPAVTTTNIANTEIEFSSKISTKDEIFNHTISIIDKEKDLPEKFNNNILLNSSVINSNTEQTTLDSAFGQKPLLDGSPARTIAEKLSNTAEISIAHSTRQQQIIRSPILVNDIIDIKETVPENEIKLDSVHTSLQNSPETVIKDLSSTNDSRAITQCEKNTEETLLSLQISTATDELCNLPKTKLVHDNCVDKGELNFYALENANIDDLVLKSNETGHSYLMQQFTNAEESMESYSESQNVVFNIEPQRKLPQFSEIILNKRKVLHHENYPFDCIESNSRTIDYEPQEDVCKIVSQIPFDDHFDEAYLSDCSNSNIGSYINLVPEVIQPKTYNCHSPNKRVNILSEEIVEASRLSELFQNSVFTQIKDNLHPVPMNTIVTVHQGCCPPELEKLHCNDIIKQKTSKIHPPNQEIFNGNENCECKPADIAATRKERLDSSNIFMDCEKVSNIILITQEQRNLNISESDSTTTNSENLIKHIIKPSNIKIVEKTNTQDTYNIHPVIINESFDSFEARLQNSATMNDIPLQSLATPSCKKSSNINIPERKCNFSFDKDEILHFHPVTKQKMENNEEQFVENNSISSLCESVFFNNHLISNKVLLNDKVDKLMIDNKDEQTTISPNSKKNSVSTSIFESGLITNSPLSFTKLVTNKVDATNIQQEVLQLFPHTGIEQSIDNSVENSICNFTEHNFQSTPKEIKVETNNMTMVENETKVKMNVENIATIGKSVSKFEIGHKAPLANESKIDSTNSVKFINNAKNNTENISLNTKNDTIDEIASYLEKFAHILSRRKSLNKQSRKKYGSKYLKDLQRKYNSKFNEAGVEEPGGMMPHGINIDSTKPVNKMRTYNRASKFPRPITIYCDLKVIQDSPTDVTDQITLKVERCNQSLKIDQYCLCSDFGSFYYYYDSNHEPYEHIHFENKYPICCKNIDLFTEMNYVEYIEKQLDNKECIIEDDHSEEIDCHICWNAIENFKSSPTFHHIQHDCTQELPNEAHSSNNMFKDQINHLHQGYETNDTPKNVSLIANPKNKEEHGGSNSETHESTSKFTTCDELKITDQGLCQKSCVVDALMSNVTTSCAFSGSPVYDDLYDHECNINKSKKKENEPYSSYTLDNSCVNCPQSNESEMVKNKGEKFQTNHKVKCNLDKSEQECKKSTKEIQNKCKSTLPSQCLSRTSTSDHTVKGDGTVFMIKSKKLPKLSPQSKSRDLAKCCQESRNLPQSEKHVSESNINNDNSSKIANLRNSEPILHSSVEVISTDPHKIKPNTRRPSRNSSDLIVAQDKQGNIVPNKASQFDDTTVRAVCKVPHKKKYVSNKQKEFLDKESNANVGRSFDKSVLNPSKKNEGAMSENQSGVNCSSHTSNDINIEQLVKPQKMKSMQLCSKTSKLEIKNERTLSESEIREPKHSVSKPKALDGLAEDCDTRSNKIFTDSNLSVNKPLNEPLPDQLNVNKLDLNKTLGEQSYMNSVVYTTIEMCSDSLVDSIQSYSKGSNHKTSKPLSKSQETLNDSKISQTKRPGRKRKTSVDSIEHCDNSSLSKVTDSEPLSKNRESLNDSKGSEPKRRGRKRKTPVESIECCDNDNHLKDSDSEPLSKTREPVSESKVSEPKRRGRKRKTLVESIECCDNDNHSKDSDSEPLSKTREPHNDSKVSEPKRRGRKRKTPVESIECCDNDNHSKDSDSEPLSKTREPHIDSKVSEPKRRGRKRKTPVESTENCNSSVHKSLDESRLNKVNMDNLGKCDKMEVQSDVNSTINTEDSIKSYSKKSDQIILESSSKSRETLDNSKISQPKRRGRKPKTPVKATEYCSTDFNKEVKDSHSSVDKSLDDSLLNKVNTDKLYISETLEVQSDMSCTIDTTTELCTDGLVDSVKIDSKGSDHKTSDPLSKSQETLDNSKCRGRKRKTPVELTENCDIEDINNEKIYTESVLIQCGVCQKNVKTENWFQHTWKDHDYLAWKSQDKPLDFSDPEVITVHLYKTAQSIGGLTCKKCGLVRKYVKPYLKHIENCTGRKEVNISDDAKDQIVEKQIVTNDEILSTHDKVVCALCSEQLRSSKWYQHAMEKHYNLAWVKGATPIHMRSSYTVEKLLKEYKKYYKTFTCKICSLSRASPIGFYAHVLVCGKTEQEIDEFKENCEECNQKYLYIYKQQHKAMHKEAELARERKRLLEEERERQEQMAFENDICTEITEGRMAAQKAKTVIETYKDSLKECKYQCPSCDFEVETKEEFNQHKCEAVDFSDTDEVNNADDEDSIVDSDISKEEENNEDVPKKRRRRKNNERATRDKLLRMPFAVPNLNVFIRRSAEEFCAYHFTRGPLFDDWRDSELELISESLIAKYLPPVMESCSLKMGESWQTYKRFEAYHGEISSLFLGGTPQCIAWAPPLYQPDLQEMNCNYLAVSCHNQMDVPRFLYNKTYQQPTLLQIWDFKNFDMAPSLALGIVLDFGTIWEMAWCPSGTRDILLDDQPKSTARLGLLAVASSNGSCYILSVPYPSKLANGDQIYYKMKPLVELRLNMIADQKQCQATSICWSTQKGHATIAVGYSDGTVSLYNLCSVSPLARTVVNGVTILYPYSDDKVHNTCVTGVDLFASWDDSMAAGGVCSSSPTGGCVSARAGAPAARVFASGALSGVLRSPHWPAALLISDDPVVVSELEWFGTGRRQGWTRAAAGCMRCGVVAAATPPRVRLTQPHPLHTDCKKFSLVEITTKPLQSNKNKKLSNDKLGMIVEPLTYEKAVLRYGIELTKLPRRKDLVQPGKVSPDLYPLADVSCLAFCPTPQHHRKLAIATHAGILFIINT